MTRGRGCRASGLRRDQGRHAHGPCSVPTLLSSRSKDRTELESSDGHAEKTHPEYSEELEELCEQLRATLDGLVRARDPAPACSPSPSPGLAAPRAAFPAPDPGFPSVALLPHLAPQCGPRPSSFWSRGPRQFHPLPGPTASTSGPCGPLALSCVHSVPPGETARGRVAVAVFQQRFVCGH